MNRRLFGGLIALMLLTGAVPPEPRGLPDAPAWAKDPENPNRAMPKEAAQQDDDFRAPDPDAVRGSIVKNAGTAPIAPASRHADAFKPQVRRIKPGQLASAVAANDGDTILLAPGRYKECGVFSGSNILIKAEKPGTAIFDGVTCENKAIFVLRGKRVTIEGIIFRNATVRDRNGAGIRAEGSDLIVRRSQFLNNENGILYSVNTGGRVLIEDSFFDGNGTCEGGGGCAHGIYINQVDQLTVRRSTFINSRQGHHVKSRARATTIEDCVIDDNSKGNSSYLIDVPNGGALTLRGNLLVKGPRTDNQTAFVSFGVEGISHKSPAPRIENNRFISRLAVPTYLMVRGKDAPAPLMVGNSQSGRITGPLFTLRN
jgi:Periplasmic copper-binding protein (NosD)